MNVCVCLRSFSATVSRLVSRICTPSRRRSRLRALPLCDCGVVPIVLYTHTHLHEHTNIHTVFVTEPQKQPPWRRRRRQTKIKHHPLIRGTAPNQTPPSRTTQRSTSNYILYTNRIHIPNIYTAITWDKHCDCAFFFCIIKVYRISSIK